MSEFTDSAQYIWISHELGKDTLAYGNGEQLTVSHEKQIAAGKSCNQVKISLSNHLGTHVDVPYHFIETGKKVCDYKIDQWIFNKPFLISIHAKPDEIISASTLSSVLNDIDDIDFLLIKTGFEQYRKNDLYWQHSPAFSDDIAFYLKENFPSIEAIGFDVISLSGYQHRELGRKAHHAFLSQDIRIFEDMHLFHLKNDMIINQIIAMPLRFENADGAPCTIIASIIEGF